MKQISFSQTHKDPQFIHKIFHNTFGFIKNLELSEKSYRELNDVTHERLSQLNHKKEKKHGIRIIS